MMAGHTSHLSPSMLVWTTRQSDLRNIDNKGGNCLYYEQERRVPLGAEARIAKGIEIPFHAQNSRNTYTFSYS